MSSSVAHPACAFAKAILAPSSKAVAGMAISLPEVAREGCWIVALEGRASLRLLR